MIYLRKLLDMFFLSMVPSLISFLLMSQFMGYITWLLSCIISVLIFYIGNALLIRRFVRDIKSASTYYTVWLITFAVYAAGGALCLWQDWMYPFTWIYFHTRIIQITTMPVNEIETWISFAISMAAFLALILIGRPVFYKLYQKEIARKEADERESRRIAREEYHRHKREQESAAAQTHSGEHHHHSSSGEYRSSSSGEHHHHHSSSEHRSHRHHRSSYGEEVYSMRRHRKMERMGNLESSSSRRQQIGMQKATGKKTTRRISDFILNIGSYEFYQSLADKVALGNDPWPIIKTYLKRRLNLGIRAGKRK